MRIVFAILGTAILAVPMLAQARSQRREDTQTPSASGARRESPFACDRLALSAEARKKHFDELGPQLRALKTGVRELSNGYAFQFLADLKTVQLLAEWAAGERLCCPFLNIEIRMEPEGGPMWLTLTGRDGTKDFIRADAGAWIRS
jgi:hypothetical protein